MLMKPDGTTSTRKTGCSSTREVEDDLADVGTMYELVLCRTANGGYFLWRLKIESPAAAIDGYTESAREALEEFAGERWIKLKGDRRSRVYEVIPGSPVTASAGPSSRSTISCGVLSRAASSPSETTR